MGRGRKKDERAFYTRSLKQSQTIVRTRERICEKDKDSLAISSADNSTASRSIASSAHFGCQPNVRMARIEQVIGAASSGTNVIARSVSFCEGRETICSSIRTPRPCFSIPIQHLPRGRKRKARRRRLRLTGLPSDSVPISFNACFNWIELLSLLVTALQAVIIHGKCPWTTLPPSSSAPPPPLLATV